MTCPWGPAASLIWGTLVHARRSGRTAQVGIAWRGLSQQMESGRGIRSGRLVLYLYAPLLFSPQSGGDATERVLVDY